MSMEKDSKLCMSSHHPVKEEKTNYMFCEFFSQPLLFGHLPGAHSPLFRIPEQKWNKTTPNFRFLDDYFRGLSDSCIVCVCVCVCVHIYIYTHIYLVLVGNWGYIIEESDSL